MKNFKFLIIAILSLPMLVGAVPANLKNDTVNIGTKNTNDKQIIFDINEGAGNPKIKANGTLKKLQFSNDGTNYKDFGSGSGGAGGVNLLGDQNFDFESGTTGWTASGGSFTIETTDFLNGAGSAKFNASASGQTLSSVEVLILKGFEGRKCQVHIPYYQYAAGSDGDYVLKVLNGEEEVIVDGVNFNVTGADATDSLFQTFDCPALNGGDDSDKLKAVITSTADGGDLIIDDIFLGQGRNEVHWGQATIYSKYTWAATPDCAWQRSGATTTWGAFGADTDCPNPTISGKGSTPDTKIPQMKLGVLPEGRYVVFADGGNVIDKGTNSGEIACAIVNGSGNAVASKLGQNGSAANLVMGSTMTGEFSLSSPTETTLSFQCYDSSVDTVELNNTYATFGPSSFNMVLTYYPSSPVDGNTYETSGWRIDANISGANPSLGTSAVSAHTGITDSGLTLTNATGRGVIAAQIPCSSTNPPTGTTCAAGDESVGVSFYLPKAQDVRACVSFMTNGNTGVSGNLQTYFQIVETAPNAQTILQEGKKRVGAGIVTASTNLMFPFPELCGTFSFSSAGQKTLRLMYEQTVAGTITGNFLLADAGSTQGQRDVHWEVYPINESQPTPVFDKLTDSLLAKPQMPNGSPKERIGRASIVSWSTTPTVTGTNGSWIQSITDNGTGDITLNFAAGIFNAAPSCSCTARITTNGVHCQGDNTTPPSATAYRIKGVNNSGTLTDVDGEIICLGPY